MHCLAAINCQTVAGYKVRPVGGVKEDGFSLDSEEIMQFA